MPIPLLAALGPRRWRNAGREMWRHRIFYMLVSPFAALTLVMEVWLIILGAIVSFTDSSTALTDAPTASKRRCCWSRRACCPRPSRPEPAVISQGWAASICGSTCSTRHPGCDGDRGGGDGVRRLDALPPKPDLPGFRFVQFGFLMTMMYPAMLLVIPVYLVVLKLGLLGTYTGVILFLSFMPILFLTLVQFFRSIPKELIESAKMDGASELQVFHKIVLPISRPILATVFLIGILLNWKRWLPILVSATSPDRYTLPVALLRWTRSFGSTSRRRWRWPRSRQCRSSCCSCSRNAASSAASWQARPDCAGL